MPYSKKKSDDNIYDYIRYVLQSRGSFNPNDFSLYIPKPNHTLAVMAALGWLETTVLQGLKVSAKAQQAFQQVKDGSDEQFKAFIDDAGLRQLHEGGVVDHRGRILSLKSGIPRIVDLIGMSREQVIKLYAEHNKARELPPAAITGLTGSRGKLASFVVLKILHDATEGLLRKDVIQSATQRFGGVCYDELSGALVTLGKTNDVAHEGESGSYRYKITPKGRTLLAELQESYDIAKQSGTIEGFEGKLSLQRTRLIEPEGNQC